MVAVDGEDGQPDLDVGVQEVGAPEGQGGEGRGDCDVMSPGGLPTWCWLRPGIRWRRSGTKAARPGRSHVDV